MDHAAAAPAALLSLRPAALIAAGGGADVSHSSSFICTSFLFCTDKLHFGRGSFRRCNGADERCHGRRLECERRRKTGAATFAFTHLTVTRVTRPPLFAFARSLLSSGHSG